MARCRAVAGSAARAGCGAAPRAIMRAIRISIMYPVYRAITCWRVSLQMPPPLGLASFLFVLFGSHPVVPPQPAPALASNRSCARCLDACDTCCKPYIPDLGPCDACVADECGPTFLCEDTLLSLCNGARSATPPGNRPTFDCLMCVGSHEAVLKAANCSQPQESAFCKLPREEYECDAAAKLCRVSYGGNGSDTSRAVCQAKCTALPPPSPPSCIHDRFNYSLMRENVRAAVADFIQSWDVPAVQVAFHNEQAQWSVALGRADAGRDVRLAAGVASVEAAGAAPVRGESWSRLWRQD
eukprot:SAG31_NODE_2653_length_5296_cov_2.690591_1_plen_297_part_10